MKYFIFIFILTASTCDTKKEIVSDSDLAGILGNSIIKYQETKDQKYLDTAYVKLNLNENYKKSELMSTNLRLTISLLMNLKKYNELEILLEETKYLNNYDRLNTLNIVKFLKFKDTDKQKANSYIKENISMINDSLNKNPKDTLLYADYFSMRMFLVGKDSTIKEIDSMKLANIEYSDTFYELLKESIKIFPDDHLKHN